MPYPRTAFVKTNFIDIADPSNPPVGAKEVNAAEMNKLGQASTDNREGLHLLGVVLNGDEFNAHAVVDEFPASSESYMWVTHASWPGVGGIVRTRRTRASTASDALTSYDDQTFNLSNSNLEYKRYALTASKPKWTAGTSYSVGAIVQPRATNNGCYYRATTGGTAQATEPTWPTADGGTVNETTVQWVKHGEFWSKWQKYSSVDATPVTQAITAAGNVITPVNGRKLISNTTAGSITLTSVPTIADVSEIMEMDITNVGTQNVVLQNQGTLAGSNLRLTATTITLAPRGSVRLTYIPSVGDWVQTSSVITIV